MPSRYTSVLSYVSTFLVLAAVLVVPHQALASYTYTSFACRYFNIVLSPLGGCKGGDAPETVTTNAPQRQYEPSLVHDERPVSAASVVTYEKVVQPVIYNYRLSTSTIQKAIQNLAFSNTFTQQATLLSQLQSELGAFKKFATLQNGKTQDGASRQLETRIKNITSGTTDVSVLYVTRQSVLPTITANRLYNYNGNLYWNGAPVGSGSASSSSIWSDNGTNVWLSSGKLGVGTTTPSQALTVAGDMRVTGKIYDTGNSVGSRGSVLVSYGTSTHWVATSTLGLGGSGATVTSVALGAPTGFSVSGSPVTSAGTLTLSYAAGYEGLKTASSTNWNSFYNTPSTRITAGTFLGWNGNTLYSTALGTSSVNTSAKLAGLLTDETGSGRLIFSTSPAFSGTATFSGLTASSTLTLSGTAANIALGSNFLSGDGGDEGIFVDSNGNIAIASSSASGARVGIHAAADSAFLALRNTTNNDQVNLYTGTTSPQNRVTAPIGSLYLDSVNGLLYQKTGDDSGNTAWGVFTQGTTTHTAQLVRATATSVPSSAVTATVMDFDTVTFDQGGLANVSANSITIKRTGKYLINAHMTIGQLDDTERLEVSVLKNGTTLLGYSRQTVPSANTRASALISEVVDLVSGDVITLTLSQNEGAAQLTETTIGERPTLTVTEVGRVQNVGSGTLFTDSGSNSYLTDIADNLLIGTSSNNSNAKFTIRQQNAADIVNIFDGATNVLTILDGGNVGIGTTTPAKKLSVAGNLRLTGGFFDGRNASGTKGMVLQTSGTSTRWVSTSTLGFTSGTVTSVALGAPTGFSVSGSPVTTSGTLALSYAAGYEGLKTASSTNWNSFYNIPSTRITAGTFLGWNGNTLYSTALGTSSINTSAKLAGLLSDKTGSSRLVFSDSPAFSGTATFSSITASGTVTLSSLPTSRLLFTGGSSEIAVSGSSAAIRNSVSDETGSNRLVFSNAPAFSGTATFSSLTGTSSASLASSTLTGRTKLTTATTSVLGVTGKFYDGSNSAGTSGMVLQTTGTSTKWVNTAALGFESPLTFSNGLTRTSNAITLGGNLTGTTTIGAGSANSLILTSTLTSAGRNTYPMIISQANDTINNNSAGLLQLDNADSGSGSTAVLNVNQIGGGNGISVTGITSGIGISFSNTTGTAVQAGNISSGNALVVSGITNGIGLSASFANAASTGSIIRITGGGSGITADYTGVIADISPARTHNNPTTRSDSGNYLKVQRSNTVNNASAVYNISGALTTFSSNCTVTLGTCTDSANILALTQSYAAASGDILAVNGVGTGKLASLDTTNASANGVLIDVQSSSTSQYAFKVTSGNGLLNDLYIQANGNVGIGTTTPAKKLSIAGDLRLTGALFDSLNSAGTSGFVLKSTGSGQTWVATSTLGSLSSTSINSSARLAAIVGNETGSGKLVFSSAPTLGSVTATSTFTLSGTVANIALGSNWLSGDGGDEGVFVDVSGNVGIGTTTLSNKLTIDVAGVNSGLLITGNVNSQVYSSIHNGNSGSTAYAEYYADNNIAAGVSFGIGSTNTLSGVYGSRAYMWSDSRGLSLIAASSTGDIRFFTGGETALNEKVRFTTDGKVGIGTSSPQSMLTLSGASTTPKTITLRNTNTAITLGEAYGKISFFGDDASVNANGERAYMSVVSGGGSGQAAIVFGTAGLSGTVLPRVQISPSGQFAIGTSSPTYQFNVEDNQASSYVASIRNTNTVTNADGLLISLGVIPSSRTASNIFVGFASATGTAAGKISGGAGVVAYNTSGADLAEYFLVDDSKPMPQKGEIVALDPETENGVMQATNTTKPFGIVATTPGFIGNGPICKITDNNCDSNYARNNAIVSLAGQVPLKVNNENGAIHIGDSITISSETGVGMKAHFGDTSVGYALEESNANENHKTIMVYVANHIAFGMNPDPALLDPNLATPNLDGKTIMQRVVQLVQGFTDGVLSLVGLHTQEICLSDSAGETCITREKLDLLLKNSVQTNTETTNITSTNIQSNASTSTDTTTASSTGTAAIDSSETQITPTTESVDVSATPALP